MAFFGFSQPADPFAGLSDRPGGGDDDALNFEDTYDGLGDQLDEGDDAFNDDTFGGGPGTQQSVGKDFDFSGQTMKMAGTLQEEQMLYTARQPPPKQAPAAAAHQTKPARTGYERYVDPGYIPTLEANASIWGLGPKEQQQQSFDRPDSQGGPASASRKMMSLEEVEAAMRATSKKPTPTQHPLQQPDGRGPGFEQQWQQHMGQPHQPHPPQYSQQPPGFGGPPQILQRPQPPPGPRQQQPQMHPDILQQQQQPPHLQPQILQRQQQVPNESIPRGPSGQSSGQQAHIPQQPRQILQNHQRLSGQGQPLSQPAHGHRQATPHRAPPTGPSHGRGPSYNGVVTHPEQLLHLSEQERAAFLLEDAKRAKRNHKIHILSKDNGLMTPQDKNYITRIQLTHLVTATGGADDKGPEAALAEDFYYQVYSQIRGAPRQNPHQPASQFAQTYLFQTGGRYGAGRRHPRGGDNHIARMEQQVQRAVEAAKSKPKNKQLVIEGSLGKISFSNSKTPKPLLNIKRTESAVPRQQTPVRRMSRPENAAIAERRQILKDIETVYATLMRLEDHTRHVPPQLDDTSDSASIQEHKEWQQTLQSLNNALWQQLKVMEPIGTETMHPFLAMLSHAKGKKAIPRIFSHIDDQQRTTILTILVIHLGQLDVVAHAIPPNEEIISLPRPVKEEVELFASTIIPTVFGHINESPLGVVTGLTGLLLERTNVPIVARTKIGLSLLTILVSRAEILKQSTPERDWSEWMTVYNTLFDTIEPCLPVIFTTPINDLEDVYVWQFLAAMGVGASPEQQQRLVLGVKDRVMETVKVSKALPQEMEKVRLGHVNLFMRAIGLDVELLG